MVDHASIYQLQTRGHSEKGIIFVNTHTVSFFVYAGGTAFLSRTFKHDDVSRREIDFVGSSVKIFNEKRPRFGVIRRVYMQDISNRMGSLLVNVHAKGRFVAEETKPIHLGQSLEREVRKG